MRLYLLFHTTLHLIENGIDKDLLSWTINSTVGIDTGPVDEIITVIVTEIVVLSQFRTGFVCVRIGKHHPFPTDILGLENVFALVVSHHVKLVESGIGRIFLDVQMGACDGLTCSGTHRHITHTLSAGLVFCDGIDICHEIQTSDNLCRGIRLELHHIHTNGQALDGKGVLEELISSLT